MSLWIVWIILACIGYAIVGSVLAVIAGRRNWGRSNSFWAVEKDKRVKNFTPVLFVSWPILAVIYIIIAPFYGTYKLVKLIIDRIYPH